MKTLIYILLMVVIFCGCREKTIRTELTKYGGKVIEKHGPFVQIKKLNEFEYKRHIYISCDVRDGIAITHAGHCWCNGGKK